MNRQNPASGHIGYTPITKVYVAKTKSVTSIHMNYGQAYELRELLDKYLASPQVNNGLRKPGAQLVVFNHREKPNVTVRTSDLKAAA